MRILVTGINGAVGGNLFRLFEKDDSFQMAGMSRQIYKFLEKDAALETYQIDLLHTSPERSFYNKFDVIFHAAAVTPKFAKDQSSFDQNVEIAHSVTKNLNGFNGKVFLFSTGSVYRSSEERLTERSELNDEDPYGSSMLKVEEAFAKSVQNLTIFRLFYPYGFDEFTPSDNMISKLLARIKGGLDIFANSRCNQVLINPFFVSDLYYIISSFLYETLPNDIYNVAGPDSDTFTGLIKRLYLKAGVPYKEPLCNETLTSPICGSTDKLVQYIDKNKLTSFEKGINQLKINE